MIIDSPIISGSYAATGSLNQTGNVVITGSLTVTGTINGSITGSITTASYALNAETLDGLDSTSFTTTSSFNTVSGSFSTRVTDLESFSSSLDATFATDAQLTAVSQSFSSSLSTVSGSLASRVANNEATGSSLTTASSSFSTRVTNNESTGSSLTTASSSFSTRTTNLETASGSFSTRVTSNESNISSLQTASGSFSTRTTNLETASGSFSTRTTNLETASGSFSTRVTSAEGSVTSLNSNTGSYATTGSNAFNGSQTITGSLTTTGQIIAQTINVQQVTSSIVYSSGSNIFGNSVSNTQQFTGSVSITGSLNVTSNLITNNFSSSILYLGQSGNTRFGFTAGTATLNFNSGLPYVLGTFTGEPLVFGTNNTEYARITSAGIVGIGTSSPLGLFEVKGDGVSYFTRGTKSILLNPNVVGQDTNALIDTSTGMALAFGTAGTERMRILSGGNVGIGTTSPNSKLHTTGNITIENSTNTPYIQFVESGDNTDAKARIEMDQISGTDGQLLFYTEGSGTLTNRMGITNTGAYEYRASDGVINMTAIDTSGGLASDYGSFVFNLKRLTDGDTWPNTLVLKLGNVGIGTTTPSAHLHVHTSGGPSLWLTAGGSGTGGLRIIKGDSGTAYINNQDSVSMQFQIAGDTKMIIEPSGNTGIGTTSPATLLQVGSTAVSSGGGSLRVYGFDGAADFYTTRQESNFNAALYLHNNPSGDVGNGTGILFRARSSSTDSRVQGAIYTSWTTSTDASRTSKLVLQTVDSGTNSDKVTILGNGNVGIGTTSPGSILHIKGGADAGANFGAELRVWENSFGAVLQGSTIGNTEAFLGNFRYNFATPSNSVTNYYQAGHGILFYDGIHIFSSAPGGISGGTFTPSERLTINNSGNVGIGATSPGVRLDVSSDIRTATRYLVNTGTSGQDMAIGYWDSANARIEAGSAYPMLITSYQGNIKLGISGGTTMTIQSSNIGIGTTSPSGKLDFGATSPGQKILNIHTDSETPAVNRGFSLDLSGNGYEFSQYFPGGGYPGRMSFGTVDNSFNYSEKMVITAGGAVGIGTTGPVQKFHIEGSAAIGTTGTEDILILGRAISGGVSFQQAASLKLGRYQNAGGSYESYTRLDFALRDNSAASNYNTNTTVMTLTNAGLVGIGTTNPLSRLHVHGSEPNIRIVDTDDSGVMFIGNSGGYSYIRPFSRDFRFLNAAGSSLMAITSGGNVGVGTTSPGEKLEVNGTIKATQLSLGDSYNNTITTDSSWSSFQTVIPTNTLEVFTVYLITASYSVTAAPYNVVTSFTFVVPNGNGSGVDNEFLPICATHQGGTGTMSFRAVAGSSQQSCGLQIKFTGFSTLTGSLKLRATILKRNIG